MQNEIIYASSAKVLVLEEYPSCFKANFLGKSIEIKEAEKLGGIFPLEIKKILKDKTSARNKLEEMFQNTSESNLLTSSLEYYLRKAGIQFTLAKRKEEKEQYLGITYENPINLESDNPKSILPCQFYLIKDNLVLRTDFKKISPDSESSSNHSPTSDLTSQLPTSRIRHPQELCYF